MNQNASFSDCTTGGEGQANRGNRGNNQARDSVSTREMDNEDATRFWKSWSGSQREAQDDGWFAIESGGRVRKRKGKFRQMAGESSLTFASWPSAQ